MHVISSSVSNHADVISTLSYTAMGKRNADLILKNCSLVSVYTREIIPNIHIAIAKDRIAYVGTDVDHTIGPKTKSINMEGKFVCPGFADPHTHIDQFVLPSELAKKSLLCGVTSLFSDPVDLVSVAGHKGFQEFLKLGKDLPIRIFQTIPGGLPVDPKFSTSKQLTSKQERSALKHPLVVGMGEVFSWTKVTLHDTKTMRSLATMLNERCIINGHTAGASGKKLGAYISAGIQSCHEPINFEQTLERLRLGMWIMVREGSIRRDLKNIIPDVISSNTYLDRLMFCSDGLNPVDLVKYGHIDHCVRESIKLGMNPIDAITIASRNCFDYYNMGRDLGGIAPGRLADIISFDNLESIRPDKVFVGGQLVVSNGEFVAKMRKKSIPSWLKKTVKLEKVQPRDFAVKTRKKIVTANTISLLSEIITKFNPVELQTQDGNVCASVEDDVWKIAVFNRTKDKSRSIGFLENFGAKIGALASTWSLHENDIITIGNNDSDMVIATNSVINSQGGMVVVQDGKILASMPLPIAGLMSNDSFEDTMANFEGFNSCIVDSGCKFSQPHLIPLFLSFLALPSARITSRGIIDVKRRVLIPPFNLSKRSS